MSREVFDLFLTVLFFLLLSQVCVWGLERRLNAHARRLEDLERILSAAWRRRHDG